MEDKTDEIELTEEELEYMKENFDSEFWPKMKTQLKEMTKKEACFVCFMAGYDLSRYSIEEEFKEVNEKLSKMSEKEIKEMLEKMSDEEMKNTINEGNENNFWEDKTKINGVCVDDKTGEVLDDKSKM